MMEFMHVRGLHFIEDLQEAFRGREHYLFVWSTIGDPANAFVLFFPILFCISARWGIKLMWITAVAEWLNLCLKWILYGERPYWYALELNDNSPNITPIVDQFHITCETGPGSPSGHAMVTGPVWFVLVSAFLYKLKQYFWQDKNKHPKSLVVLIWSAFTILLILVCISRLHIAAHFPHQVIAGTVCGLILAGVFTRLSLCDIQLRYYLLITVSMLFGGYLTYFTLLSMGHDPHWSVKKALKWCTNPDWVHMNTVPFHTLARLTGAILGLGLGLRSTRYFSPIRTKHPFEVKLLAATLAVTMYNYVESVRLPHDHLELFYAIAFVKNLLLPFVTVAVVPHVAWFAIRRLHMLPPFAHHRAARERCKHEGKVQRRAD